MVNFLIQSNFPAQQLLETGLFKINSVQTCGI